MILQANKKFIDTSHVAHLLTAGEKYADKLVFSVERFYQETDLSGCLFVMRGVNSAGNLALETLSQEVMETEIRLTWNVSPAFTAVSGMLALEIVCYDNSDRILKYTVTPMQVKASVLEEYSGGVDAIEEALKEMERILTETRTISVHLPQIRNGTWWLYDTDSGAYTDSGLPACGEKGEPGEKGNPGEQGVPGEKGETGADGKDGFSPIAAVVKDGSVVTITITDVNGTTTVTLTEGAAVDLTPYAKTVYVDGKVQELSDSLTYTLQEHTLSITHLEESAHTHDNLDVLNKISGTEWTQLVSIKHYHNNIETLNSISPADYENLSSKFPARITALEDSLGDIATALADIVEVTA